MKLEIEADTAKAASNNKVTPSILDAFDLLKASKDDIKIIGGAKLISRLQSSESARDVPYVLKRVVRSLGANVPEMRTGYFATLVTLLCKDNDVSVPQLQELVKKELHVNNSSKSEVGDVALGQILVCGAIFRSGMMFKCNETEQKDVLQMLLTASKKKSYLSTVAYLILLDFVKGLNAEQFSSVIWSNIKSDFEIDLKDHTLDTLYFLMIVSSKFPEKVKLKKLIGNKEIICDDNVHVITEKLMTGIDFNSINHPVYYEIGKYVANSPHLNLFWTSGIDCQLVKHNRNRELVAINILTTIFNNIKENVEVIPELLSKNFFKLFMDWFKGLQTASKIRNKRDDEDDQKLMIKKEKELLVALAKALKNEGVNYKIRVEVLKKLLFNPGEMNFAELTGSTVVKSVISDLDKEGVKKITKSLKGVLFNTTKKYIKEDVERTWYNNERLKAAELISTLVSHESVKDDFEFKLTYMKFLMCFGFFKIGGAENSVISNELSSSIKACFYRCFSSRFTNVDSLVELLSSLSSFINEMLNKENVRAKLEKQFPKENMECWSMLIEVCKNIEIKESKSKVDKVFLILLYQLGLYLFSEPTHVKMARGSIKELNSCYEHYNKGKKKKVKKVKQEDLSNDEPEWIEVLVEVLLSILSTESSVLRSIVQCVLRLLWEYLSPSSIGQIVSVLDPESESNPLSNENGSADEEESDEEDNEITNDSEKKENGDEDENEDSDETEEEEDDDDDELKTPEQLRLAVQKALGKAVDSDAESIDIDMLDEEEGKKLDEALADAFKQFSQGKGKKNKKERKDKKALSDFRIRVLDLIDIYLEKEPSMDVCLTMIMPLCRCLEFCIQDNQFRELENRVRKTLKNLTKIKKFSSCDGVTLEVLTEYMNANIAKGCRSHFMYQAVGDVITQIATFIIHCSQKIEVPTSFKNKETSPLLEILKEAFKNYFQNRSCLLPIIFFHTVLQLEWDGVYDLAPLVVENVFNTNVRQFRRNEGLELLVGFYRNQKRIKPSTPSVLKKISKLEKNFESTLMDTLKEDTGFEAKNNFFVTLNKLVKTIQQFYGDCKIQTSLDFESLLKLISACKAKAPANSVQHNVMNKQKKKKKRKQEKTNAEPQAKRVRNDSN